MSNYKWLSIFLLAFCFACDKPIPTLHGMDLEQWKGDKNGCQNIRAGMRKAIDEEKDKLLSLGEMQVVKLLGKPDRNELSRRNQKFFYYFIEPAPACKFLTDSIVEKLVIRFNAMGLAKEVAIE